MASGKSHELGGQRTQVRHNIENLGVGGLLLILVNRLEGFESWEQNALMYGGMAIGSAVLKWLSTSSPIRDGLLKKIGILSIVAAVFTSGCAVQLGSVKPHFETGPNGNTIVACEVKGVSLALGDGGICRNVEGGHVSQFFSSMFTSTVSLALGVVGSIFGGIGGIGAAMTAQPIPAAPTPDDHPPAIIEEAPADSGGSFF